MNDPMLSKASINADAPKPPFHCKRHRRGCALLLNRASCREVLECGSALPLWEWVRRLESGKSTAALQDAGAHAQAATASGAQSVSEYRSAPLPFQIIALAISLSLASLPLGVNC